MKYFNLLLIISTTLSLNCQNIIANSVTSDNKEIAAELSKKNIQDLSSYETAYFASGCFWCVEAIFESVKGVEEVVSGYSGGTDKNPTYEQVARGLTSHAETVKVYYNPKVISFTDLVKIFFGSHDPTTLNRQGPDHGRQYRSIAFYKNDAEKAIITDYITLLKKEKAYGNQPITTEIIPFDKFYKAEDYHQDYEQNNPNNSYIKKVSIPRLNRFKEKFGDYLKTKSLH